MRSATRRSRVALSAHTSSCTVTRSWSLQQVPVVDRHSPVGVYLEKALAHAVQRELQNGGFLGQQRAGGLQLLAGLLPLGVSAPGHHELPHLGPHCLVLARDVLHHTEVGLGYALERRLADSCALPAHLSVGPQPAEFNLAPVARLAGRAPDGHIVGMNASPSLTALRHGGHLQSGDSKQARREAHQLVTGCVGPVTDQGQLLDRGVQLDLLLEIEMGGLQRSLRPLALLLGLGLMGDVQQIDQRQGLVALQHRGVQPQMALAASDHRQAARVLALRERFQIGQALPSRVPQSRLDGGAPDGALAWDS